MGSRSIVQMNLFAGQSERRRQSKGMQTQEVTGRMGRAGRLGLIYTCLLVSDS